MLAPCVRETNKKRSYIHREDTICRFPSVENIGLLGAGQGDKPQSLCQIRSFFFRTHLVEGAFYLWRHWEVNKRWRQSFDCEIAIGGKTSTFWEGGVIFGSLYLGNH